MSYISKSVIAALVVWLTVVLSPAAIAAEPRSVIDVTTVNVNGDVKGFVEFIGKARAIAQKLRPDGKANVYISMAAKAGPNSGLVTVAVRHPSHAAWAEAQQVVQASPEWRALMNEFAASGYKMVSSSLNIEVASFE